jgi:hypothetical protein
MTPGRAHLTDWDASSVLSEWPRSSREDGVIVPVKRPEATAPAAVAEIGLDADDALAPAERRSNLDKLQRIHLDVICDRQ